LGDGSAWGLSLSYVEQTEPRGLADAFRLGRSFIGSDSVAFILGDNIFHGPVFGQQLRATFQTNTGATVFAYRVSDPERYGVVAFGDDDEPTDVVEKPVVPPSNWAVTGLYFYDNRVVDIAASLAPSPRGELEITDVNRAYLRQGALSVVKIGRGVAWLDTGTHASMNQASEFIRILEQRQGLKIGCPEEIAFICGYISAHQLAALAAPLCAGDYGTYLLSLLDDVRHDESLSSLERLWRQSLG
jgi:glucose-1-phosphate thymidylyltransferase